MRKNKIPLALLLFVAALLLPLLIPAAHSQTVEGTFEYKFEFGYQEKIHGKMFYYLIEHEWWTGTFNGTAHAVFVNIIDKKDFETVDLMTAFTGTVNGKTGSLVIYLAGEKQSPEEDWAGDWKIVRGIGELANLRGHGTWGGPGYEGPFPPEPDWDPLGEDNTRPDIWYKGTISTEGGDK